MATRIKPTDKHDEYPHRLSPLVLAFEAEIKRVADERCVDMARLLRELGEAVGVKASHIYNYRTGKTDIPASTIPKFCRQFGSNALALALVEACMDIDFSEMDLFDLGRFASRSVQDVLRGHDDFLQAFDDGVIDGHELTSLSLTTQKIIRNAIRLREVAFSAYDRRNAAAA